MFETMSFKRWNSTPFFVLLLKRDGIEAVTVVFVDRRYTAAPRRPLKFFLKVPNTLGDLIIKFLDNLYMLISLRTRLEYVLTITIESFILYPALHDEAESVFDARTVQFNEY